MKTPIEDRDAWQAAHPSDKWVYDKLLVAQRFGVVSGPGDVPVPAPGEYIVRPITNLYGMSAGARFVRLIHDTSEFVAPGEFWAERLYGTHWSVDYDEEFRPVRVDIGVKHVDGLRFASWLSDDLINAPDFPLVLYGKYHRINIELIGGVPIEIHLRGNPNPRNVDVIWDDSDTKPEIPALESKWLDCPRKGFNRR